MDIKHDLSETGGTFVADDSGTKTGHLTYEWDSPEVLAITHTVVKEAFRGQGVAKALLDEAVSFAREKGYRIRPVCPYVVKVFQRDSQYNDISTERV